MNLKRMFVQSYWGRCIRRKIHKINSRKTYSGAIEFLNNWGVNSSDIKKIANDMFEFCKKYNYSYVEYMFYHFYVRDIEERLSFISSEERIYCCEQLNKARNWDIFENKANTYNVYKEFFNRDVCIIRDVNDKKEIEKLVTFITKHKSFMAKTLYDAGGVGITKYELSIEDVSKDWIEGFISKYPNGCICEELIIQSNEYSKFHPESVNTLRITTVRFDDHVEVIHPAMRIGTGKSYVDNAGSEGILCAIDLCEGKIIATANERGESFIKHPDTGMSLIGCEIPHFEEALELAKQLAMIVPTNRYTGWDLAHTDFGWVLVEANSYGGFIIWQIPLQKGFKSEWESIVNRIKCSSRR